MTRIALLVTLAVCLLPLSASAQEYATKEEAAQLRQDFRRFVSGFQQYKVEGIESGFRDVNVAITALEQRISGTASPPPPAHLTTGGAADPAVHGSVRPTLPAVSAAPAGAYVAAPATGDMAYFMEKFGQAHAERQQILNGVNEAKADISTVKSDLQALREDAKQFVTRDDLKKILKAELAGHLTEEELEKAQDELLNKFFQRLRTEADLLVPRKPPVDVDINVKKEEDIPPPAPTKPVAPPVTQGSSLRRAPRTVPISYINPLYCR